MGGREEEKEANSLGASEVSFRRLEVMISG
jgi:hypothetical protein